MNKTKYKTSLTAFLTLLSVMLSFSTHAREPGDIKTEPTTGMKYVWVPKGCFMMGSNDGDYGEEPVHEVCVDGFWMGQTEVTQAQYKKIMGSNPSKFKGNNRPVERVSWSDARMFVEEYNYVTGGRARLPTEAEWEYACLAGGLHSLYCGGGVRLDRLGWYEGNSDGKTHNVAGKRPNAWGLYDMSGNVWEWVQDWYSVGYYAESPKTNPRGPSKGSKRVLRGGSWVIDPLYLRSAKRYRASSTKRNINFGFRLVQGG